jgi:hypothetical protein
MSKKPPHDDGFDPGAKLCGHPHRVHYLGGGLYVCFSCWAKMLIGPSKGAS